MTMYHRLLLSAGVFIVLAHVLLVGNLSAQPPAPSPYPPDSLFVPGVNNVVFRPDVIDPDYFCIHPWPDTSGMHKPATGPSYITPTVQLIRDSATVQYLVNRNATLEPAWPTCFQPCGASNRREITQWGDTLRLPFWNKYVIHFSDTIHEAEFAYSLASLNYGLVQTVEPIRAGVLNVQRATPNDPNWSSQFSLFPLPSGSSYWGSNVEDAWDYTFGSDQVRMACFDGGFDPNHSDFKHWNSSLGVNETNIVLTKNYWQSALAVPYDYHGQFCAGIMGALTNNKNSSGSYIGVAGIAGGSWASGIKGPKFYLAKVLSTSTDPALPTPNYSADITALDELTAANACEDRVRVFNLSYGNIDIETLYNSGYGFSTLQGYARAYRRCAVICNAKMEGLDAAHTGDVTPVSPSWKYDLPNGLNDEWIIGIGAHRGDDGARASWCAYGGNFRIMACGTAGHVYGLSGSSSYAYNAAHSYSGVDDPGGTSWSSPHVAGTAALILSRDNTLLNDDVAGLIEGTAKKAFYLVSGTPTAQQRPWDARTGFGALNAGLAVGHTGDVNHGFIDAGAFDNTEFDARVTQDVIDPAPDLYFNVQPTDLTDPFPGPRSDSTYEWQRIKVTIKDVVVGSSGQTMGHAWGVGMGHDVVQDTKGWEPAVVSKITDGNGVTTYNKLCTETPYAKVDPASIQPFSRKFAIYTYVYKVTATNRNDHGVKTSYYPTDPRHVAISYGWFAGQPTWSIADKQKRHDQLTADGVFPNPVVATDRAVVRFTSVEPGDYTLSVVDVNGVPALESKLLDGVGVGEIDASLDVTTLSAGVYFCVVKSTKSGAIATSTFTVVR